MDQRKARQRARMEFVGGRGASHRAERGATKVAALSVAIVLVANIAPATVERLCSVTQPIEVDGTFRMSPNTYVTYSTSPGTELLLTTAENRVRTPHGFLFLNMNSASRAGLAIQFVKDEKPPTGGRATRWDGLFGDTLRVVLDLRAMPVEAILPEGVSTEDDKRTVERRHREHREWCRALVEVTLQCMVENAAREPKARFLDVRIEGPSEFEDLAGTRSLRSATPASN